MYDVKLERLHFNFVCLITKKITLRTDQFKLVQGELARIKLLIDNISKVFYYKALFVLSVLIYI